MQLTLIVREANLNLLFVTLETTVLSQVAASIVFISTTVDTRTITYGGRESVNISRGVIKAKSVKLNGTHRYHDDVVHQDMRLSMLLDK